MNDKVQAGRSCELSEELANAQLKQNLVCTQDYLTRNKKLVKEIINLKHKASYEVCSLLDAALGRVTFEVSQNKRDIKNAQKMLNTKSVKLNIKKSK